MLLRTRLLLTLAGFVGSSPAFAYPLNDGTGGVVWAFEGTASDFSGGAHTITGSLRLSPTVPESYYILLDLTAVLDGTDALAGSSMPYYQNSLPGSRPDRIDASSQIGGSVVAVPSYAFHPTSAYWGQLVLAPSLVDQDGVAFDTSTPPDYAPDIALFETHQLSIWQESCQDILGEAGSYCSQGGGSRECCSQTLSITIDRFVDPVAEPASLGLVALALAATTVSRRRTRGPRMLSRSGD